MKSYNYQYLQIFKLKNIVRGFTQVELLMIVTLIGILPTTICSAISMWHHPAIKLSSNPVEQISKSL